MQQHLLRAIALVSVSLLICAQSSAQPYPNKPIRLVIPFAEGGASGHVSRSPARGKDAGSAGFLTAVVLPMELFKSITGTDIMHIPYKGSAPIRLAARPSSGGHLSGMKSRNGPRLRALPA